ncbi:MAG: uracil-DNA glycosylase [Planctomycetaceae bacterium]|nr:uracil-DNA glycosylase [Planctomycetaceae bacterium]
MQHGFQDNDLVRGLTDYLETLQMAGVDAISLVVPQELQPQVQFPAPVAQQEETMPQRPVTVVIPPAPPPVESPEVPSPPVAINGFGLDLSAADREATLRQLAAQVALCNKCAEPVANRTQTVFGVGNPFSELVFLGEAPGADEDRQGVPFVGRAGKLLTDMIEKGMKLKRDDVYICNILRCRPPGNRNPSPNEAALCRPFLDATLQVIRPKFICCLGSIAATNLLNTPETIGRLRGRVHGYQGVKVVCTYHPAYLLRNPSAKSAAWDDLKLLMREMGLPVP